MKKITYIHHLVLISSIFVSILSVSALNTALVPSVYGEALITISEESHVSFLEVSVNNDTSQVEEFTSEENIKRYIKLLVQKMVEVYQNNNL